MSKVTLWVTVLLSVLSTLLAIYTFLRAEFFLNNLPWLSAPSIDTKESRPKAIFWESVANNVGLFVLFGLTHSLAARKEFKQKVSPFLHRPIFLIITTVFLNFFLINWKPLTGYEKFRSATSIEISLFVLASAIGLVFFVGSNLTGYGDIFGISRIFHLIRDRTIPEEKKIEEEFPYDVVRHPRYLGFLIQILAQFFMPEFRTFNRLLFFILALVYLRIGMKYEERDYIRQYGDDFIDYSRRVDALIPIKQLKKVIGWDVIKEKIG
jgi:protein-S-isoprenylcysteine O-methyltransferase Ste14